MSLKLKIKTTTKIIGKNIQASITAVPSKNITSSKIIPIIIRKNLTIEPNILEIRLERKTWKYLPISILRP